MSDHVDSQQDQEAIQAELAEARAKLEGLAQELSAVEATLEDMATERAQYGLVQQACGALEKLSELGGAELFWGDALPTGQSHAHVQAVRERVDGFEQHVAEIEQGRKTLLDQIRAQQSDAEWLEDDLDELKRQEEQRKLEWVIEREIGPLPETEPVMPWSRGGEDDQRFRKSLAISLLLALLLGLLTPLVDLPVPEKWEVVEVSERFTRLIKEEEPPPPPPVAPKQEELIPEEQLAEAPQPEPKLVEETAPEPVKQPKPEVSPASKGILAFREQFSSLADSKPSKKLGASARINRSGEAAVGRQGRSLVTTQTPGTSGGINLAAISRDAVGGGGGDLEGVAVGTATSSIGSITGEDRPLSGGPGLGRTDEEIQIVFDRHKSALYRLYNRELRRDPTLKGQIVLRLTIEPDGSVSLCEVQSSDMDAPKLSSQIATRVKGFDFGAKEGIPAITILYPIDFLPAT